MGGVWHPGSLSYRLAWWRDTAAEEGRGSRGPQSASSAAWVLSLQPALPAVSVNPYLTSLLLGFLTHSSVLAWRIPGTAEPRGLPSMDGVAQSRTQLKWLSSSSSVGKIVLIWGRKIQNSFEEEDFTTLHSCFKNEELIHVKSENNALIHLLNVRY